MIEVLESDYVEMARLKGLSERTVLIRHALPNALGPAFQVIAINLAYLAGGVIVVEYIFNYPGIGGALVDAVNNHDIPVVQALAMLIAAVYVVLNLLADIATILVTPRLRTRCERDRRHRHRRHPGGRRRAPADRPADPHCARAVAHAHRAHARGRAGRDRRVRPLFRAALPHGVRRPAQHPAREPALRHRPPRPGRLEPLPLGRRPAARRLGHRDDPRTRARGHRRAGRGLLAQLARRRADARRWT